MVRPRSSPDIGTCRSSRNRAEASGTGPWGSGGASVHAKSAPVTLGPRGDGPRGIRGISSCQIGTRDAWARRRRAPRDPRRQFMPNRHPMTLGPGLRADPARFVPEFRRAGDPLRTIHSSRDSATRPDARAFSPKHHTVTIWQESTPPDGPVSRILGLVPSAERARTGRWLRRRSGQGGAEDCAHSDLGEVSRGFRRCQRKAEPSTRASALRGA